MSPLCCTTGSGKHFFQYKAETLMGQEATLLQSEF